MLRRAVLALCLLLGSGSVAQADDVLLQIVNLDCQFCARMDQEGAITNLVGYAKAKGVDYRVLPFGPVETVPSLHPHGAVTLFYVAAKLAPDVSPSIASHFYRYFAQNRERPEARKQLFDVLSVVVGVPTEKLKTQFNTRMKSALKAWSGTAAIIRQASAYAGFNNLETPSFVLISDGRIDGFVKWAGSVKETTAKVRQLINGEIK